jgi:hypothetical protein
MSRAASKNIGLPYMESSYVFVCSQMHPLTGIYEIKGILVDDEYAEAFLHVDREVKKVEVFTVGKLSSPINVYHSLEEFNGEE